MCDHTQQLPREQTRQVQVGAVAIGGGAPIPVQSMCNTKTTDVDATLAQIRDLAKNGCDIVRVTVPTQAAADSFVQICAASPLPVVADIHFDWRLAISAIKSGAAAVRINPGNIGSFDHVDAIIDAAGEAGIPIRIGVNAGSLDKAIAEQDKLSIADKLVHSAISFTDHLERRGFYDFVLSAKVHGVPETIETNRRLSQELPHVPLHIGVTEAGTRRQGTVKNSIALGVLLAEGIGDTIRVSLTDDPAEEVRVGWEILSAIGLRRLHPELVSCPTCGRTQVDLIGIARQVEQRLQQVRTPISVAVMGCVVNGPGEARGADIGVACGKGQGMIFVKGKTVRKVKEDEIIDALFEEIDRRWPSS
ncbi:MAG: flavodoxin-dependent (E)-4-hydroxy-3-methylbut-2-enyl-diphosphate synthase [Atopobiaceae bacterium]|jgi:(E)-4-hydroxy-3-methylbut-2-enyl-diphosphate synthase|nr:flavodoxin-dependent (E)-4-hydroxy-3-methylbut-2-enyl-diphosphate synthase [Atopobiaceae bacterium]